MHFSLKKALLVAATTGMILKACSRPHSGPSSLSLFRRMDIDPDPVPIDPDTPMPDAPETPEAPATPGDPAPADPAPADPAPAGPAPVKPAPAAGPAAAPAPAAPLSVAQLQSRGDTATSNLDTAISQNTADKNVPDFTKLYSVTPATGEKATPDLGVLLRPLNKNPRSTTYTESTVINKVGGDPKNPILQLKVSTDQGVMINEVSYANRDSLNPKTRWSDMAYQSWSQDPSKAPELDMVIQRNIQNDDTNNAINGFHTANKIKDNQPGTWAPGSDQYRALMGSDNGRPIAYLLTDHHQALGNKKVTSIITYAQGKTRPRALMGLVIGN
ncbi:hypothetical protein P7C71_g598, partial [Lecanoromycetidae sp. Uapishka_2]